MSRVCVALAVRNGERYLVGAIESVLAQEGADLELRVIDNRSTDRSVEIARSYDDPRVVVTVNERDLGYYGSLNRALRETTAELFVPFAADDLFRPGNLAAKIAALAAAPEAGFAYGPVVLIDDEGVEHGIGDRVDGLPDVAAPPLVFEKIAPLNDIGCPGTTVVRTAALRAIGGFDETLPFSADWQAWLLLSLRHPVAVVQEPLVSYRTHSASGTTAAQRDGSYAEQEVRTLRRALDDPHWPADWPADRKRWMLATLLARVAHKLRADGHLRRGGGGPAAYAFAFDALLQIPRNVAGHELFQRLCVEAELVPPAFPLHVVTAPPAEAGAVADAVAVARTLDAAGLLGSFGVAGDPDALVPLLEAELDAGPDVTIDFVPGALIERLFKPGSVVLGRAFAGVAEAAGLPAVGF